jgi:hypothetical protein
VKLRTILGSSSVALAVVAACASAPPSDVVPVTVASVAPVPKPPASAPTAAASASAAPVTDDAAGAGAWTDETAVAALAKDCHWNPGGCLDKLRDVAKKSMDSFSEMPEGCEGMVALACASVPGQSCAPDECSQTDYTCIPACDDACSTCSDECTGGCEKCKAKCQDEACKLACGKACGQCHQNCLKRLDACSTAHCSEESERCFRERDDEWNKSACGRVCDRVSACVDKCPDPGGAMVEKYASPCADACMKKLGKGCPARFDWICKGFPDASVNFFAYHAERKGKRP